MASDTMKMVKSLYLPKDTSKLLSIVFITALALSIPLLVWGLLTQRFELRKRAATAEPSVAPTLTVPTLTPVPGLPGDIDGDGDVDIFDYNILIGEFGKVGSSPADIDGNGKVDIFDYNILVGNFGKVIPTPSPPIKLPAVKASIFNDRNNNLERDDGEDLVDGMNLEIWACKLDEAEYACDLIYQTIKVNSEKESIVYLELIHHGTYEVWISTGVPPGWYAPHYYQKIQVDGNRLFEVGLPISLSQYLPYPTRTPPTSTPAPVDEEELFCQGDPRGTWTQFNNSCADYCWAQTSMRVCALVLTDSCDCGQGYCWNGTNCDVDPKPLP